MRLEGIGIKALETMAKKDPDQRASWYRLCDSHGEIATQVSGDMPVNEKLSVFESDKAGL
jgi:alkylated DNA nucleotide flippase Atl1